MRPTQCGTAGWGREAIRRHVLSIRSVVEAMLGRQRPCPRGTCYVGLCLKPRVHGGSTEVFLCEQERGCSGAGHDRVHFVSPLLLSIST